ncbi:MAG: CAP domain-containing protein [Thermoleophilia bacterium]
MPARAAAVAALATVLSVVAVAAAPAAAQDEGDTPQPQAAPAPAQMEAALLAEMNRVREARDRRALRPHPALRAPARAHSRYQLRIGQLTHEGRGGTAFWERLAAAGFPRNRWLGENVAMMSGCEAGTARRTVAMWMASPPHRANLLNPRFRWAGAGVAIGAGCSATYVTADYGS